MAALPTGPLRTLFVRQDLRSRRKIVVIDDRVADKGSQNLVDPYEFPLTAKHGSDGPTETMIQVVCPQVRTLDPGRFTSCC